MYIYYFTREFQGSVEYDSGATIRDTMKSIQYKGACNELYWKYNIEDFTLRPSFSSQINALDHKSKFVYMSVNQNLEEIKQCIFNGFPIVFGFIVFESFENERTLTTGEISMPNYYTEYILGGHAIIIIGYSDETQRFILQNSWGINYGNKGYFTMPYEYVLNPNLSFDFWCCTYF